MLKPVQQGGQAPGGTAVVEARAVLIATIVAVMTLVLLLGTVASDQARLVIPGQECRERSPLSFLPSGDSSDRDCPETP